MCAKGHTYKHTEEAKAKMGAAHLGKKLSKETKEKIRAAKIGRKVSKETRDKISAANTGKKQSKETRDKIRAANLGKKLSKRTKAKLRACRLGKKHSKESRAKISKAQSFNGGNTQLDFISFVVTYISASKNGARNPVMADIIQAFIDTHPEGQKPRRGTLDGLGPEIRKSLELRGRIAYASLNTVDRRIRYLSPTPRFPSSSQKIALNKVIEEVLEDIRIYRVKRGWKVPKGRMENRHGSR